ncbi:MAG: amino acid adenylation domain-containing protein [Anaerolineae bacterium]|nr:amino acid adenylation domain-containing protein [Anaerolineae bacterium]
MATDRPMITLPLSAAQRNAWILHQFQPDSPAFNVPLAFRIEGALDPDRMERCLNQICQRHDVLRMTYPLIDGEPVVRLSSAPCTFVYTDLRDQPKIEEQLPSLIKAVAQRPFQFADEVPLRVNLWQTDDHVYWLLIVSHHMAMDGFSSRLLLEELSQLYHGAALEELPELPMRYAEYVTWQRNWQGSPDYADQLEYWKTQLRDFPTSLDLPTDFTPPAQPSDRGTTYTFALTTAETATLRAYCAKQRTTPYICYVSALFVVLYRYTQQTDLTVGMPVSVRNQIEIENLIGYFANQLPIRAQLQSTFTFNDVLKQVTQQVFGALDQQDIPFEELVKALLPERSLSYTPLFRVIMVLHKQMLDRVLMFPDCMVRRVPVELDAARLDIYWTITDGADQFAHSIEFSTELFTAETIARLAEHVQTLLTNAMSAPEQTIAHLPLMTAAEQQRLLIEWNATERDYPSDQTVISLLEQQIIRTPDAPAYYYDSAILTFQQLNDRVNQLAHLLMAINFPPETLIGVCLEPSFEMIITILAIMKAGGAYVPLDPAYPFNRRALIIKTAEIQYVITLQALADSLPEADLTLIRLDADADQIARHPVENPPYRLTPDQLAYVLFTSGSTGVPKGVMGHQRGIILRLAWMWSGYPFTANEVGAVKTSINFVDSLWELYGSLLCGLPSVILTQADRRDPQRMIAVLAQQHVTRLILVPTLLEAILQVQPDLERALPDLRFWMSSGEALPPDLVTNFAKAAPHAELYNIYGSSEMCDIACYRCVPAETQTAQSRVPIGKPLHNVKTFVLDSALQPVPIGVIGELYASGAALSRGYLNAPEQTARKFLTMSLPDPQRVYRTGDLAKYLPDGTLLYLGRADNQVKLRGFRIELDEIDTLLRSQPTVAACATIVSVGATGAADQLISYVVLEAGGGEADLPALWAHLRQNLPDYMVPARLIVLDSLPTTPNGKIDRRALPLPDALPANQPVARPTNELEARLLDLWRVLLHSDAIGIHDRFFDCGGNSLLAIQLITRINRQFNCNLAVSVLFHTTTIAQFATLIRAQSAEAVFSPLVTIRRATDPARLSIFCFHALFGNILFYDNLIHHLPAEVPIYGFQAQGVDGSLPPLNDIEQLAESYFAEIVRVQPNGPYCLIGYSMGGKIAMEIGRRLLARGQAVPLLMIIDDLFERNGHHRTQDGHWRTTQAGWFDRLAQRITSISYGLLRLAPQHRAAYLRERWQELRGQVLTSSVDEARPTEDVLPPAIVAVAEAMYHAVDTYFPTPYRGHITFIRAQDDIISIPRFRELHRLAAGGFTIHDLPGKHFSIVRPPYAEALARKIAECYQRTSNST